jgi:hypothetical protein
MEIGGLMFRAGGRASFNLDEGEKGKKRGEKEDSARLISDLHIGNDHAFQAYKQEQCN